MAVTVAIVTGSNKGIGYGIVKALCQKFQGDVYLAPRDQTRGSEAVAKLNKEGLQPKYHTLDVCDEQSILKLRDFMKEKYGGIDVLVNNAGIASAVDDENSFGEQAKTVLKTNYWANRKVSEILFDILNPGARVVNITSSFESLCHLVGDCSGDKVELEFYENWEYVVTSSFRFRLRR